MESKLISKSEKFMIKCLKGDSAHDKFHVYRVLNLAMTIAESEKNVNLSVLIIACLLHDIGREKQFKNPKLCHAEEGAKMAFTFLIAEGMDYNSAVLVRESIKAHRYRGENNPDSMEAKILFDADTIDVIGAIGIARSLQYQGKNNIPIYNVDKNGKIIDGIKDSNESFFKEYEYKLKNLNERLYTRMGKAIADKRKDIVENYFMALKEEIYGTHAMLETILQKYKEY